MEDCIKFKINKYGNFDDFDFVQQSVIYLNRKVLCRDEIKHHGKPRTVVDDVDDDEENNEEKSKEAWSKVI